MKTLVIILLLLGICLFAIGFISHGMEYVVNHVDAIFLLLLVLYYRRPA